MRRVGSVALLLCVAASAAFAEGASPVVETASVVTAVTLHPDAAIVTREATVTLPDGASTVVFTGVPSNLAPDSLQATGESDKPVTLGAVEARLKPHRDAIEPGSPAARLKELQAQRAAQEAELEALRAKLEMIKAYAALDPEKLGRDAKPLTPSEWNAAFDTISAAHAKAGEAIQVAIEKLKQLDADIAQAQAERAARPTLQQKYDLAVAVSSQGGGVAKLRLAYRTDAASWRPSYVARLNTGDKGKASLELESRAQITQRTEEDWKGAALTVSTVRARRAASPPEVAAERVAFREPPPVAAPAPMARAKSSVEQHFAAGAAIEADAAGAEPLQHLAASRSAPIVVATGYAASFKITEPGAAPGDGTAKAFLLSTRHFDPSLTMRAAPEFDPQAYLEAHLVNDGDAPLLPGQMSVERDGMVVGAQQIALLAPGDARDFGFGVDEKVKITRAPVDRKENGPTWLGQTKTDAREFKTTVKNLHDFAVAITVVDRVPFSENAAIEVETLPQTTPPSEKQLDDKRGVLAWRLTLQPGESKEVELAYRVKWPADKEIDYRADMSAVRFNFSGGRGF